MQDSATIGIIGLGLIGTALSERLIEAGVPSTGFDINPERCEALRTAGGAVATSVRELAGQCGIGLNQARQLSRIGCLLRSQFGQLGAHAWKRRDLLRRAQRAIQMLAGRLGMQRG